jgi:hypothetical protein
MQEKQLKAFLLSPCDLERHFASNLSNEAMREMFEIAIIKFIFRRAGKNAFSKSAQVPILGFTWPWRKTFKIQNQPFAAFEGALEAFPKTRIAKRPGQTY